MLPAYIGPGAGFAFLGSFLSVAVSFLLTAAAFLLWPFRAVRAAFRRRLSARKARVQRIIFLGLDGLDPGLTERYMAEGKLPNFSRLREQGSFHRLRTTFPALSPVAWSTFATGVSPAKHNIFDFLNRSLKTYAPELAASKVHPARRVWRWFSRPDIEMRRKSQSFWKILGEHAVSSTILRVPITFPPEEFDGRLLSAMCTPDLRGTQGSFTLFSTKANRVETEGGTRCLLTRNGDECEGSLEGPVEGPVMSLPFQIVVRGEEAVLRIDGESHQLTRGEYSPWVRLTFRGKVSGHKEKIRGIARFLLTEASPEVSLYVTPIQIDPEAPALPISHPAYYSAYLANLLGSFATVGMAEDTWALNEGAIDESEFLAQAYSIMDEREAMFDDALAHTKRGVVACVFDTSDRVQHMFFRHRNDNGVIEDLYRRMDRLLGKTMEKAGDDTILFALSDHGFCSFRRAVNLNSWLHQNGYLAFVDGAIDWSATRAYCLGLSGLYVNLRGRESCGIVSPGVEADALKNELVARLSGFPDGDAVAIRQVYATSALYRGPYLGAAPDLIIGYNEGYRTSWEAAVGKVTAHVIEDNCKAWSGDHCVDPVLVPGVLFCNRKIDAIDPGIEDMAPTALDLFGVTPPAWMDGKSVFSPS